MSKYTAQIIHNNKFSKDNGVYAGNFDTLDDLRVWANDVISSVKQYQGFVSGKLEIWIAGQRWSREPARVIEF